MIINKLKLRNRIQRRMPPEWLQILTAITNVGVLTVGVKLVRHLSRMELKVETMWAVFMRRFGQRENEPSE